MAGITLVQAEAQLALWLAADAAVATSQSYSIAGRSLSRADAAEITNKINYWQGKVLTLTNSLSGRGRTRYVVPQ
jgi:hypothetical protein